MDDETVARIEDWEQRQFSGGHAGLADLADGEFSGAVRSGQRWLFMLNGRVVGTAGGAIEDFAKASGTAYEAPHPGLPLLLAMRERGGETKARYFTDDTPLREVHDTLSSGSFTGYVELSENVHSGDYYLVYYGGRALKLAFVGGTGRLITDEEAFERAADEVGIYEVRDVDLDVRDVPEPDDSTTAGGTPSATEEGRDADVTRAGAESEGTEPAASDRESTGSQDAGGVEPSESAGATNDEAPGTESESGTTAASDRGSGTGTESVASKSTERTGSTPTEPGPGDDRGSTGGDAADPFSEERAWRETRSVPALDPEETSQAIEEEAGERASGQTGSTPPTEAADAEHRTADASTQGTSGSPDGQSGERSERLSELQEELEELRDRLESVESERDRLREEREELERRLERLRETHDVEVGDEERSMPPGEALERTNLLVRYGSKGDPTLEDAHGDPDVTPREVDANLRLETHTRFDAGNVVVNGESYESFVTGTLEYRFAAWVARTLLFEVRDTGNAKTLSELYDAIPEIDRVEFDAAVTMRDDEGEERREAFDVIFRDQMGQPIAVANLNDDRDPATGDMMVDLVESADAVVEAQDSLSAAFSVTASFFEPRALETAEEATSAGLLNRDSRKSFVKTSRKRGYHLCLVEAHDDEFRVAVPDL